MSRKTYLSAFLLVLMTSPSARGVTVEASWQPVTKDVDGRPETISHYILYFGPKPRPAEVVHPQNHSFEYQSYENVGRQTTVRQANLEPGQTYYFSVAAVDIDGNLSNYSNQASITTPVDRTGKAESAVKKPSAAGAKKEDGGCSTSGGGPAESGLVAFLALLLVFFPKRLARLHQGEVH